MAKKEEIEQTQMTVQNPEWDGETQEQAPWHRSIYQAGQTGLDRIIESDHEDDEDDKKSKKKK
jgi:hypothetical protein